MELLKKVWFRFPFSMVIGAMIVEIVQSLLGEMPRNVSTVSFWIATLLVYAIISLIVYLKNRREREKYTDQNSDVIDSM